eukprot:1814736-Amphidinium_carterae.1
MTEVTQHGRTQTSMNCGWVNACALERVLKSPSHPGALRRLRSGSLFGSKCFSCRLTTVPIRSPDEMLSVLNRGLSRCSEIEETTGKE